MTLQHPAAGRPLRPATAPRFRKTRLAVLLGCVCAAPTYAGTTDLGDGLEAVWSINASLTGGWRTKNADPDLLGAGDGGSGSAYTGSANKNFDKGDNFSTLARLIGDVNLRKDGFGVMLRAKAWDNYRLSHRGVNFGAASNNYTAGARLSDSEFDTNLSKFSGVEVLDAYFYGTFAPTDNTQATLRVGQHVVNFGESMFVPGINQYSVLDVSALRQAGTLLKEGLLPVPQISGNLSLPDGTSIEAFYQLEWKRTAIDGCGTYWSPATALNCTDGATLVANDAVFGPLPSGVAWNGAPQTGGMNFRFSVVDDRKPTSGGQLGLGAKHTFEAIDTELGAYYVRYKTHVPNLSGVRDTTTVANSVYYAAAPLGSVFWDYDAKPIQVAGLSASTVLGGWAFAGEVSYTHDFPVQISSVDGFYAMAAPGPNGTVGIGPMASRWGSTASPLASGAYNEGRDYKNKVQVQASTVKLFSGVLGASSASLLGEVAFQHWSGIGDPYTSVRYGRGFEFGAAQHAAYGGACPAAASNAANCTMDGYFTSNAWGLRGMFELEYPSLIPNVVVKPRIYLQSDVKGWSADGVFSEGRYVIAPGLKFDFMRTAWLDVSYTHFNPNARFDSFHDRDYVALVLGAAF